MFYDNDDVILPDHVQNYLSEIENERLFEKLPQEAANKLLVKLKRDYEVDVE